MRQGLPVTESGVLATIGERIARHRIARRISQAELAEEAGLGLRTVQRLELGQASINLAGFIKVLRVLGLIDQLDHFIPEPPVSPIAQLRSHRKQPKRVRRPQPARAGKKKWTWADDK